MADSPTEEDESARRNAAAVPEHPATPVAAITRRRQGQRRARPQAYVGNRG